MRMPNYDAASHRVLNNGKALQKGGHEVSFISWGGAYREEDLCEDGKYRIAGMEYMISGEIDNKGSFFSRMGSIIRRGEKSINILNNLKKQPDVIILYNASRGWTNSMISYCRNNKITLVSDITEWYDNNELYFFQRLPNWLNMIFTQKKLKNKIVISSYLDKLYSLSHNIILPPLCDMTEAKWDKAKPDARVNTFAGITLIYAGTPAKKDCLHTVINVVNKLIKEGHNVRFLILGAEKESYLSKYKQLIYTGELHENILFLGRIPHDFIPAYYKMADFMVLLREPTRKNMAGFPTKVAESLTAGVPVITNRTSDLGKYIVPSKNGYLLEAESFDELYSCLNDTVLSLSRRQINEMKEKAKESSVIFDYNTYIDPLNKFIESLI